jgi:two-component system, chemotaxis family, chemotaxis protein CheY
VAAVPRPGALTLLVVDDSQFARNRIQRAVALRHVGRVVHAANGREAIEAFRREQPDLVTMDLTMPELDGIAATTEMVRLRPDVRILVVSALADKATAIEALKRGACGFLLKPFDDLRLNDALALMTKGVGHG